MGTDVIQAHYETLEAIAAQFRHLAEQSADTRRRVQRSVRALQAGWAGRGAAAFFHEMDTVVDPAMQRLHAALTAGDEVTREIVRIMREAEVQAAEPFRGLGESDKRRPGPAASSSDSSIRPSIEPEHPLQQQAREKYEHRYREAMRNGTPLPEFELRGGTWSGTGDMFAGWLLENGPAVAEYGPGSPQVQDMKDAPAVAKARQFFLKKNEANIRNGTALESVTNYIGDFPWYKGPFLAGLDPTEQFVGSYRIDIYPVQNYKMQFVLTNVTSRESFFLHLPVENVERGSNGWGGNQTQVYWWIEAVPPPPYRE